LTFGLVLAGCPAGPDHTIDPVLTPQTNNSIANDEATLGFVAERCDSSYDPSNVATAEIVDGKIKITSVQEGTGVIRVYGEPGNVAGIPVTVAADGGITIGAINKGGPRQVSFTIKSGEHTIEGVKILDWYGGGSGQSQYIFGDDDAYGENSGINAGGQKTFGPFMITPGTNTAVDGEYSVSVYAKIEGEEIRASFGFDIEAGASSKDSYTLVVMDEEDYIPDHEGVPRYKLGEE
jgi:hypothetical protein